MSSATSRLSSFGTDVGYGEQEHDANSALLELDKGEDYQSCLCRISTILIAHRRCKARSFGLGSVFQQLRNPEVVGEMLSYCRWGFPSYALLTCRAAPRTDCCLAYQIPIK